MAPNIIRDLEVLTGLHTELQDRYDLLKKTMPTPFKDVYVIETRELKNEIEKIPPIIRQYTQIPFGITIENISWLLGWLSEIEKLIIKYESWKTLENFP